MAHVGQKVTFGQIGLLGNLQGLRQLGRALHHQQFGLFGSRLQSQIGVEKLQGLFFQNSLGFFACSALTRQTFAESFDFFVHWRVKIKRSLRCPPCSKTSR